MLEQLASVIQAETLDLRFTILEIGAMQIGEQPEPFYYLLDFFPGSQIIGFEVDQALCEKMNSTAKDGVIYYPVALGQRNERRKFYITNHPMCSSLYEPNEPLNSLFNNLEVANLLEQSEIDTKSLDSFVNEYGLPAIDFLKIDVQGAELDIFKGGTRTLEDVLAIVCEVEFIPHYYEQPLFGDVCSFLSKHNQMFHKFIGLAGRALKPIVIDNNPNLPSQHIWSDAMFIRHIQILPQLSDQQLLKLSLLAGAYNSPDLSYFCLAHYDERNKTSLAFHFLVACSR